MLPFVFYTFDVKPVLYDLVRLGGYRKIHPRRHPCRGNEIDQKCSVLICYTNASCDDLETFMCAEDAPPAIAACLENCGVEVGEFQCTDGSDIIPESWVCDCYEDCDDGSDEANCRADACFERES